MSISVNLTWNGDKLIAALEESAREAGTKTVTAMVELSKQFVPVDTGLLQSSIKILENSVTTWSFGSEVRYAIWVEIGAQGRRPRRYLANAGAQLRHEFFVHMKAELSSRGW